MRASLAGGRLFEGQEDLGRVRSAIADGLGLERDLMFGEFLAEAGGDFAIHPQGHDYFALAAVLSGGGPFGAVGNFCGCPAAAGSGMRTSSHVCVRVLPK